jgi:hypothetical protein
VIAFGLMRSRWAVHFCAMTNLALGVAGCRGVLGIEDKRYVGDEVGSAGIGGNAGGGAAATTGEGAGGSGCASDLASSSEHCGACGHDCLGGRCESGQCQPGHFTFAGGPTCLGASSDTVYWTDYFAFYVRGLSKDGSDARSLVRLDEWHRPVDLTLAGDSIFYTVYNPLDAAQEGPGWLGRIPLAGGPPSVVATSDGGPWAIAADESHVYFTNRWSGASLSRIALDGSDVEELLPEGPPASQPLAIALDATHAYVTHYGSGSIERVPKGGGEAETLVTGQDEIVPVLVVGDDLLWSSTEGIWSAPKSDPSSAVRLSPSYAKSLTTLGEFVYYVSPTAFGRLRRDGSDEEVLLSGLTLGADVIADGVAVYFADQGSGTIGRYVP